MKRLLLPSNTLLLGLISFGFCIQSARAEWKQLFDGKSLDGWTVKNGWAEYRVEDGAIVGKSVPKSPNTFLCTDQDYGDFLLIMEVKVDEGLNSGIQFRSQSFPEYQEGRVHGYQYELDTAERRWTAGIYDEARRGWLYPVDLNPPAKSLFRQNDWNEVKIECVGNSLRTWLNGRPVAHVIDDLTTKGFIALQVHGVGNSEENVGKEVAWRNIRINTDVRRPTENAGIYIRNLLPNNLSRDERGQGWKLLWDGESTKGWRQISEKKFPKDGWEIKDGVLTVLPDEKGKDPQGGDIVTVDQYGAFELDFEFMPTKGANSGIKYFVTEGGKSALGLEYQILDDSEHPDAKMGAAGNRTCASLYDLIPSERSVSTRTVPMDVGKWNHGRIISYPDGRVEHWLNGFKVVEYTRGNNVYRALVARSKYADKEGFGLGDKGYISLQDHHDRVSFRSLKIREL
ncbi:MAG: DUF1080 domain-containing protein [Verrucomicrobiae bacterium]|nr:DUF1080 domain-containing protein [Verrucomicrobiae bacterium]